MSLEHIKVFSNIKNEAISESIDKIIEIKKYPLIKMYTIQERCLFRKSRCSYNSSQWSL